MAFSKRMRKYLWPIYGREHQKFIPMMMVFFIISFNYNILRAAKDTLIVTAPSSGAEAIPFIKVWVMLPTAFLITYIFTRLSNKYKHEHVFYIMLTIFLAFFAIFTLVLYPARDVLHPHNFIDKVAVYLPSGIKGFLAIFRNWTFTTFYVMSELWGTAILTVLFWGFANEVTPVHEAKRFYSLFGVGANISGSFGGYVASIYARHKFTSAIPYGSTDWEQSVLLMNITVIIGGIFIMLIYRFLHKKILTKDVFVRTVKKTASPKMSLRKNFAYLAKSKYLIYMALIVLTYNITINLTEIIWKNQVKMLYPNPSDYTNYMGHVMMYMGIIATIIALFVSGNLLRKFNWVITALLTPLIVLVTGILFFLSFSLHLPGFSFIAGFLNSTPLMLTVFFGSMQNCMARASKYTLFDASKEIAYIPLTSESKTKGKAAIDGVGSRIGKSGGSIIYQGLLLSVATLSAATPYVAVIFLVVIGVWLFATFALGKQFNVLNKQHENLLIEEEKKAQEEKAAAAAKQALAEKETQEEKEEEPTLIHS